MGYITTDLPKRCIHCDRYCAGCSFGKSRENQSVPQADPLDAARGIVYGLGFGVLAWAAFVGFILLIYFNVHA